MSQGDWVLILLVVAGIAVWLISAALHPYVDCPKCEGSGKHRATIRPWARRSCHYCSGTGQRRSLGAVLLRRGNRRRRMSKWAPKTGGR